MADATIVHTGENSPEYVAYRLYRDIAHNEGKNLPGSSKDTKPDRKWILDTYAQCLRAVKGYRAVDD